MTTGTVYQCPECDELSTDRRCPDCNLFTRRIGPGGHCPSCDDIVLVTDLTSTDQPTSTTGTYTEDLTSSLIVWGSRFGAYLIARRVRPGRAV